MSSSEEPKIIVDEDWKAQVKAEKDALRDHGATPPDQSTGAASPDAAARGEPSFEDEPLPEPTLTTHVMSLATQAMIMMGVVPNPQTGKVEQHLGYAKHLIDTIRMLETKTQGTRTPEEISMLSKTLHELRMMHVSASRASAEAAPKPATESQIGGAHG